MFQENSAQKEVDDLIQEMKIMQEIGSHPNVVTILGVCTEQGNTIQNWINLIIAFKYNSMMKCLQSKINGLNPFVCKDWLIAH